MPGILFDAKCLDCGDVHIVRVPEGHEEGDTIRIAHEKGGRNCSGYAEHELVARLRGIED